MNKEFNFIHVIAFTVVKQTRRNNNNYLSILVSLLLAAANATDVGHLQSPFGGITQVFSCFVFDFCFVRYRFRIKGN